MQRVIAVILFTLFNLGAFGVTIEQHLCCHSQQEESTTDHCSADESCCDDSDTDCCDKIVSQIKIPKDFTSQGSKISFELSAFALPAQTNYYSPLVAIATENKKEYASICYFPPPTNFQILHSTFLI